MKLSSLLPQSFHSETTIEISSQTLTAAGQTEKDVSH